MKYLRSFVAMFFVLVLALATGVAAQSDPFPDVIAGDPNGDYANVEFSPDGRFMVWLERSFSGGPRERRKMAGTVWHCAFDIATGTFMPPDCRGYRAFASTALGRANPGQDASGPFYAGIDEEGRLIVVRPTGPTSGTRTVLPLPADPTRRAIYAADTPDLAHGWIFFIKNEKTPGSSLRGDNAWFELRAVSLAAPSVERTIVRQGKPDRGMPPLDVAFARFIKGTSKLTFGMQDSAGLVQVAEVDMQGGNWTPTQVTFDPTSKIDPYGFTYAGREWLLAGINATAMSQLYARPIGGKAFEVVDRFGPGPSMLEHPGLAQSHEPFLLGGELFSAFQANDRPPRGRGNFFNITFGAPGEIYIATVGRTPTKLWRASPSTLIARTEPEPISDGERVWIFYNEMPGGIAEKFRLRRIEVRASQLIGPNALPALDGQASLAAVGPAPAAGGPATGGPATEERRRPIRDFIERHRQ
jgi:hypothetical protein